MTDVQDAQVSNMAIPIFHAPEPSLGLGHGRMPTIRNPGFRNDDGGPGRARALLGGCPLQLGKRSWWVSKSKESRTDLLCALEHEALSMKHDLLDRGDIG
jgi:hypothetical protein